MIYWTPLYPTNNLKCFILVTHDFIFNNQIYKIKLFEGRGARRAYPIKKDTVITRIFLMSVQTGNKEPWTASGSPNSYCISSILWAHHSTDALPLFYFLQMQLTNYPFNIFSFWLSNSFCVINPRSFRSANFPISSATDIWLVVSALLIKACSFCTCALSFESIVITSPISGLSNNETKKAPKKPIVFFSPTNPIIKDAHPHTRKIAIDVSEFIVW